MNFSFWFREHRAKWRHQRGRLGLTKPCQTVPDVRRQPRRFARHVMPTRPPATTGTKWLFRLEGLFSCLPPKCLARNIPDRVAPLLVAALFVTWEMDNAWGPLQRAQEPIMPNRNQQRARPCFTPARGHCTSDIVPRADRTRLYQSLCADPVLVLNLLQSSNIGHLSELEGWSAFCRSHPDEAQRVIDIALRMGIAEKPEKRRCANPSESR